MFTFQLGIWSVQCEAFKWNADSLRKRERRYSCEKEEPTTYSSSQSYQPKRRRLKIVAKVVKELKFFLYFVTFDGFS